MHDASDLMRLAPPHALMRSPPGQPPLDLYLSALGCQSVAPTENALARSALFLSAALRPAAARPNPTLLVPVARAARQPPHSSPRLPHRLHSQFFLPLQRCPPVRRCPSFARPLLTPAAPFAELSSAASPHSFHAILHCNIHTEGLGRALGVIASTAGQPLGKPPAPAIGVKTLHKSAACGRDASQGAVLCLRRPCSVKRLTGRQCAGTVQCWAPNRACEKKQQMAGLRAGCTAKNRVLTMGESQAGVLDGRQKSNESIKPGAAMRRCGPAPRAARPRWASAGSVVAPGGGAAPGRVPCRAQRLAAVPDLHRPHRVGHAVQLAPDVGNNDDQVAGGHQAARTQQLQGRRGGEGTGHMWTEGRNGHSRLPAAPGPLVCRGRRWGLCRPDAVGRRAAGTGQVR